MIYQIDPTFDENMWPNAEADLAEALRTGFTPEDPLNVDPSAVERWLLDHGESE